MDFAWRKCANFTMIFKKPVVMCTSQTVLCNNHCLFVFGKKSGSCELVFQVNGNLNRVSPGNKKKRVASSDLFTFLLHHQHFVYFFFVSLGARLHQSGGLTCHPEKEMTFWSPCNVTKAMIGEIEGDWSTYSHGSSVCFERISLQSR